MLHILRQVTDATMLSFIMKSAEGAMPYFGCFSKLGKILVKVGIRVGRFRGSYMTLVQACRETNSHTLPTIQLLMNCMVELYGVDLQASYQHAFVYIRQMAIHLRSAMTTITKDSFKAVYNWQYIHCLRLWARVIGAHTQCGKGPLDPLLYPLVQVLDTTEMRRSPKPSTLKPLNFELHIRAPNEYLHTRTYHVGVAEQVTELFLEYEAAYADSLAYPELMTPAVAYVSLKLLPGRRAFRGFLSGLTSDG
ncbi:MAG: Noc2p family-domain-containing protein [Olpidium bornovanus]|uniref:Noc2p family-domain-containing protein n=1 Tax=Olpidium bornovanus TaxID=278681 RepID=A0A8H8DLV2_9FUNG|nr:MAG: Noc2p family-domain-containing protein [Olpidium bornovanus]